MIDVVPERGLRGAGSPDYQQHRTALLRAETDLRERIEDVARRRRELPPGPVMPAYRLVEGRLTSPPRSVIPLRSTCRTCWPRIATRSWCTT